MPQDLPAWALLISGAAAAGFVQGVTGFAFSIVALSFWAWALPPETAATLAVLGALTGQLTSLFSLRRGFDLRRLAPFVFGGVVGVPIGVFLLHNIEPTVFRLALGALFALYGFYGLLTPSTHTVTAGGWALDAVIGGVGGVLGGLSGLSGSVPAIWTQWRGWKRDTRRALMQAYNIVMHMLTLFVYARAGALNGGSWKLFAIVAPVLLVASLLGVRAYKRIDERGFSRAVLALICLSGAALCYGAAHALWKI